MKSISSENNASERIYRRKPRRQSIEKWNESYIDTQSGNHLSLVMRSASKGAQCFIEIWPRLHRENVENERNFSSHQSMFHQSAATSIIIDATICVFSSMFCRIGTSVILSSSQGAANVSLNVSKYLSKSAAHLSVLPCERHRYFTMKQQRNG